MNFKIEVMRFACKYLTKYISPYTYNKLLKIQGVDVGEHTRFFGMNSITIDTQRPWMLKIGDYCKITQGCIILCHDYSRSVIRRKYGEIIGEAKRTIIGDNVFIGMNSIILMGTKIGNNVIVGAGSVVSGNIPDNVVIAGNPAKILRSLDEHREYRKSKCVSEAKEYFCTFRRKYNKIPTISEMGAFFTLFTPHKRENIDKFHIFIRMSGDDETSIIDDWLNGKEPLFSSYEEFIDFCMKE